MNPEIPDTLSNSADKNLLSRPDKDSSGINSIRIGVLVSKRPSGNDANLSAWHGAELAVSEFNRRGGFEGRMASLAVRSCDGPWGTGSKQAVNLIFQDSVIAILGSTDGRNAHLIEQVVTKARMAAISALATESSLTQAFVPWFYRIVPNDLQQAEALADAIYKGNREIRLAILYFADYDSRNAARAFEKVSGKRGTKPPIQILYNPDSISSQEVADIIMQNTAEAVLFFGSGEGSGSMISDIAGKLAGMKLFVNSWGLYNSRLSEQIREYGLEINVITPDINSSNTGKNFSADFKERYGYTPDAPAAYAYDGMNVLLKALLTSGPDREKIRDALAPIELNDGVSGPIRFDVHGNLSGLPRIIRIK